MRPACSTRRAANASLTLAPRERDFAHLSMTTTTSIRIAMLPAITGWQAAVVRVESQYFVNVAKPNRHPAQGCFPMTD